MSNATNVGDVVFQIQLITTNIYAYLGLIMFVVGTVGNVCNIVVFTHLRSLSSLPSSCLLLASFVGSQFVLSTAVLSRVIFGFSRYDPLVSSIIWCKIRWVLGPAGGGTALTSIGLASVDRYFITSRQINRHRWITVRRAHYMILAVVLFWLLVLIPNAIYYTAPSCTIKNSIFAQFSPIFSLTAYSTAPLLILAVFCTLTWFNLHSDNIRTTRLSSIQYQVNKMMIAQICIVLITSVPNIFVQIYTLSTRTMVKSNLRQAEEKLVTAAITMFGYTAYAGSFYVYLIASRKYRKNVRTIIFRRLNQLNHVLPQVI